MDSDARGIVRPEEGLRRFSLHRCAPSPEVGRFVDRYWIVRWDLRGREPHIQRVLSHPVVNVVFEQGHAEVHGVTTRTTERTLEGAGRVLGVMFRPAGFRPFLGRSMSTLTDRTVPLADVLGGRATDLAAAVAGAVDDDADDPDLAALVDRALAELVPADRQPSEHTTAIAEHAASEPSIARTSTLAARAGMSVRQLQRRFADHVGLHPKAVLRRYRLYEAAERARHGTTVDWSGLAVELGYSDQAHLTRDFCAAFGLPPGRYARLAGRGGLGL